MRIVKVPKPTMNINVDSIRLLDPLNSQIGHYRKLKLILTSVEFLTFLPKYSHYFPIFLSPSSLVACKGRPFVTAVLPVSS